MPDVKKYAAFISYSHKDEAVARWFHRRLELYAIPKDAAEAYGQKSFLWRRIGRVFRDREELPAGFPLSGKISEALAQSDALIVLCSPNSAKSEWVNKEIIEFQRLGKGNRIFPVIIGGEDHEIFPSALSEKREILEADMRDGKDGRDHAVIKIIAGLMGIEPYELTRRDAAAQSQRLGLAAIGLLVFAGISAMAMFNNQRANDTLNRFFVTNGEAALKDDNPLLAMRYALAGNQESSRNRHELKLLLANAHDRLGQHRVFNGHVGRVLSVGFSPDGSKVVSGSDDHSVRLWDVKTGKQIGAPLTGHEDSFSSVGFSPDGTKIVSGSHDKTVRLWDVKTGKQIGAALTGHEGGVYSVGFSPDGTKIVSGSGDNTVRLWDVKTGKQIGAPLTGHEDSVSSVGFSPDGTKIVSGSHDKTVRLWDVKTGKQIGAPLTGHERRVNSVGFSPDGAKIVSGSDDKTLRLWDAKTGKQIGTTFNGHIGYVNAVSFSPDGTMIVSGSDNGTLRLWDAKSGEPIGTPMIGHEDAVSSVAYSPDSRRVVSGSLDKTLRLWDSQLGMPIGATNSGEKVKSSSEDRYLRDSRDSETFTKYSRIFDEQTGKPIIMNTYTLDQVDYGTSAVGYSADESKMVFGYVDSTIRIVEANSGLGIGRPFIGHTEGIYSVEFSRDGKKIVSGSVDMTIRIWDVKTSKQLGIPRKGDKGDVYSVYFSADGRKIQASREGKEGLEWNIEGFNKTWDEMATEACLTMLGQSGRRFKRIEIDADPLLFSRGFVENRDVCKGVNGVPPLSQR